MNIQVYANLIMKYLLKKVSQNMFSFMKKIKGDGSRNLEDSAEGKSAGDEERCRSCRGL